MLGRVRHHLREIFRALVQHKECEILEGHLMPDHVHMCIAIPPKYAVASVIGFVESKSMIVITREVWGKERNFTGEHLCARKYEMSKVRIELKPVRRCVRDQQEGDGKGKSFKFGN